MGFVKKVVRGFAYLVIWMPIIIGKTSLRGAACRDAAILLL